MKKIFMFIATLALTVFGMSSVSALRAGSLKDAGYSTWRGNKATLTTNVPDGVNLTVVNGETVNLDLAGFSISEIIVNEGGTLTITDTVGTGVVSSLVNNGGDVTIYGGTFPNNDVSEWVADGYVQNKAGTVVKANIITINGTKYYLAPGETLNDLELYNENFNFAETFVRENQDLHFRGVNNKMEIALDRKLPNSLVLETYYTVTITFKDVEYTLELVDGEGELQNAVDANGNTLEAAMKALPEGKAGVKFYSNGKRVYRDTVVSKHTVIDTVVYTVSVTYGDTTEVYDEGTKVKDIPMLAEIAENKNFDHFVDAEGNIYTLDSEITENVKLIAVYAITITVDGNVTFTLYYTDAEGAEIGEAVDENGTKLKDMLVKENFVAFKDSDNNYYNLTSKVTEDLDLTTIYFVPGETMFPDFGVDYEGPEINVDPDLFPDFTVDPEIPERPQGNHKHHGHKGHHSHKRPQGPEINVDEDLDPDFTVDVEEEEVTQVVVAEDTIEAPNTVDSAFAYIGTFVMSIIALIGLAIVSYRKDA